MSVADKLQTIQNIKENIKTAINNKGGNVGDDFTQYSTAIDGLSTGGDYSEKSVIRNGMKLGYSNFETPDYLVFANDVTDFSFMFYGCGGLRSLPDINTSNATNMTAMFYTCGNLENAPNMITSNVTSMNSMFNSCTNLTTIPELDTSNVTDMDYMFCNCTNLTTIPELDCSSLESIPTDMFYGCTYLTNVGGFTNLRYSIDLGGCMVLSQQSLNNIISKLIPVEQTRTIRFYTNLEGRFSEEMIASATEKNWIISFSQFAG